jgi:hypothetical protein
MPLPDNPLAATNALVTLLIDTLGAELSQVPARVSRRPRLQARIKDEIIVAMNRAAGQLAAMSAAIQVVDAASRSAAKPGEEPAGAGAPASTSMLN